MGPIEGSKFTVGQAQTLLDNEKFIEQFTRILGWEDAGGFTQSGKTFQPATSRAILKSTDGKYLGAAERKTPAELTKEIVRRQNENAILRAARELARPVETPPPGMNPPPIPGSPGGGTGPTVLKTVARAMNPILAFLELLTHSTSLNSGEKEWLQKRDAEEAEVRKRQRFAEELKAGQQSNPIIRQIPPPPGSENSVIRQVPQNPSVPRLEL